MATWTARFISRTIEGILYILITGSRWQDLPRQYGAPTTVWRRLKRWGEEGVRERIWRMALAALDGQGQLDWSMAFLDGSFAPAKKGGEKVGLTKKGKGTKWMLVVDGNGLPVGFHLDSATWQRSSWLNRPWTPFGWSAHEDVLSADQRSSWRIGG